MSDQEDPMRTTVKPVRQWTTMDGKSARKSNIEKWLFGVVLLWAVVRGWKRMRHIRHE